MLRIVQLRWLRGQRGNVRRAGEEEESERPDTMEGEGEMNNSPEAVEREVGTSTRELRPRANIKPPDFFKNNVAKWGA